MVIYKRGKNYSYEDKIEIDNKYKVSYTIYFYFDRLKDILKINNIIFNYNKEDEKMVKDIFNYMTSKDYFIYFKKQFRSIYNNM